MVLKKHTNLACYDGYVFVVSLLVMEVILLIHAKYNWEKHVAT